MRSPDRTATDPASDRSPSGPFRLDVLQLGDGDAVVTARGPLHPDAVASLRGALTTLEGRRARRIVVDLTGGTDVPEAVGELLDRLRVLLVARGGWLLVEGVRTEREPTLLDVFAAYSEAVHDPGPSGRHARTALVG